MKDIKALLKEAREAIKNKDFALSIKLSKTILREDKSNYMALVFLGLALQEVGPTEQASKAFQKAIELNPTNPLAWNGLVNYYEKLGNEGSKEKLVETYLSALEVESNPKKMMEYSEKLSKLYDPSNLTIIIKAIYSSAKKAENNDVNILEILVKLYENCKEIPSDLYPIIEESLNKLLSVRGFITVEFYSLYLNLLYQQNKFNEVVENAEKMHALFESNTTPLIWLCKIFNQTCVEELPSFGTYIDKLKEYCKKLLDLEPKNVMGLFSLSIQKYLDNNLIEARDLLKEVTYARPGLVHAWVLLTKIYFLLEQYDDSLKSFSIGNKLLNSGKYKNESLNSILNALYLIILSKSTKEENWNLAIKIYSELNKEMKENNIEYIITVYINLQRFEEAKSLISDLKPIDETKSNFLEAKLLQKQKKYKNSLELLEKNIQNNSEWLIEIGLNYWFLEDYKNALVSFLKAAKCDTNNYLTFFYLGNYYKKMNDFDKARRCYEKAFNLNQSSQKVAKELSQVYCKLKNWEAAQNLLLCLTNESFNENNSWAWSQLALTYLEQQDYAKAIEKLQFLVRIDKENTYYWHCLADAYFTRGSYTSALKCYEKSLELGGNSLYPALQRANIKKILGIYDEAKDEFMAIISENENYLPALKGLSETSINQAWKCYRDQRLGTARDHAQFAIKYLTMAIHEKSNFSCMWKLIGDVCLFVTNLPDKYCYLSITDTLLKDKTMIEREDMFSLATTCYIKSIGLTENNILIWQDLSNCYLKHALHTKDEDKRKMLFLYANAAAKHCSSTNPKNWQHWNLLGTISMLQDQPNYAIAQHYFIKSVTVENNNPISWSNLGILYMLKGDIKLANKAFAQGQRSDPNYINNWIGQALIAEFLGVDEAMDLFRHSVQLGHHQQGALGYAHWVCQTLLEAPKETISYSIENMHAIPVASDALTWYTEKNNDNDCAWNMLGILKERMKLNKGSLQAFKNAYQLSRNNQDSARVNYGRLLYKQGEFISAANVFQEVQEATFSSGSGLALTLFKNQNYEESYAAYEQALHWLTEEQSHQSELLVALAAMAYMFQGLDGAKTLLFQSIQLKPPSPWGLYSTLSLGLIHKDLELAELVLKELKPLKDSKDCLPHYATLLCTKLLREEKPNSAIKELSKLVHRHPDNASVWLTLAITILRVKSERKRAMAGVKCSQIALKIGQAKMDITKVLGYISLGYLLAGDLKSALISAQKALFCYPDFSDGWVLLLAALVKDKRKLPKDFILNAMNYAKSLNSTELIINWLNKFQRHVTN